MSSEDTQPKPVRLRATVTMVLEYDAPAAAYGTADPTAMAAIDAQSLAEDHSWVSQHPDMAFTGTVEVIS